MLIIVSNRLPVTLTKHDNEWVYTKSSGGLVSALTGMSADMKFTWIGWVLVP